VRSLTSSLDTEVGIRAVRCRRGEQWYRYIPSNGKGLYERTRVSIAIIIRSMASAVGVDTEVLPLRKNLSSSSPDMLSDYKQTTYFWNTNFIIFNLKLWNRSRRV
jgi:hypothetical protein